jgi:hypothetical protein
MDEIRKLPSVNKSINKWVLVALIVAIVTLLAIVTYQLYNGARTDERMQNISLWTRTLMGYYSDAVLPASAGYAQNGAPLYSWRFREWIYLYARESRDALDHAWDSPSNSRFRMLRPYQLSCNNDGASAVALVTGKGTAFESRDGINYSDVPPECILAIEYWGSTVHWMQPGDFPVELLSRESAQAAGLTPLRGRQDAFFVGFADGKVWLLKLSTPPEIIQKCCLIETANAKTRNDELSLYRIRFE